MRPIIYHVSIDSILFKPVCPSMGMWITYGSVLVIIVFVSFLLYYRNSICSTFNMLNQDVLNLTTNVSNKFAQIKNIVQNRIYKITKMTNQIISKIKKILLNNKQCNIHFN